MYDDVMGDLGVRAHYILVGSQLVINTNFPNAGLGSDPWFTNSQKIVTILYTYKSVTCVQEMA